MKQLNRIQSAIFLIGGLLMVAGVACCVLMVIPTIMCWVYLLGAVMFATMQVSQLYEGNELVVRRLKKLQNLSDLLFVLAHLLAVDRVDHELVRNKGVLILHPEEARRVDRADDNGHQEQGKPGIDEDQQR